MLWKSSEQTADTPLSLRSESIWIFADKQFRDAHYDAMRQSEISQGRDSTPGQVEYYVQLMQPALAMYDKLIDSIPEWRAARQSAKRAESSCPSKEL